MATASEHLGQPRPVAGEDEAGEGQVAVGAVEEAEEAEFFGGLEAGVEGGEAADVEAEATVAARAHVGAAVGDAQGEAAVIGGQEVVAQVEVELGVEAGGIAPP